MQRRRAIGLAAASLAALGLLVAGCGGGGGSPQVASLGGDTTTTSQNDTGGEPSGSSSSSSGTSRSIGGGSFSLGGSGSQLMRFAACMRSHGIPNFPDPNAQGVISGNLDPGSPQFQQAQRACSKDLPHGGTPTPAQEAQMRSQALAYSACMRSHGLPNFPDPDFLSGGRVALKITAGTGIDPRSPQFQAAQKACQSKLPGKAGIRAQSGGPK
jgi:hypothetical protein